MGNIVDPRTWLEHLSVAECWSLLAEQDVARLAVVVDRKPEIFPINIAVPAPGSVVFRTAEGTKLEALGDIADVALEVDGADPARSTGWSVLASGSARHVTDGAVVREFQTLDLQPWAPGHKIIWVQITVSDLSGRRINPPADG
jgi:nitroimidazol reductase NimA-like FMN-containing flavoprotein (pyridoxamine 5'-phosphate oxidase superfamily)